MACRKKCTRKEALGIFYFNQEGTGPQSTPIRIYTVPKFLRAGTAIPNFNPVTQQATKTKGSPHFQNQLTVRNDVGDKSDGIIHLVGWRRRLHQSELSRSLAFPLE
jgi:hypothetical protein